MQACINARRSALGQAGIPDGKGWQHFRGQEYSFPTTFLTDMVRVFLDPKNDGSVREEFSETYVEEYDDIRFYTLEALELVLVPLPKYCSDSSIGKFWLKPSRKHCPRGSQ